MTSNLTSFTLPPTNTTTPNVFDDLIPAEDPVQTADMIATGSNTVETRQVHGTNALHAESNVSLLWIPYVILTCIIVGLMALSFLRFHRKNGHKYQRRRMEMLKQVNMQKFLTQIQDQVTHDAHLPSNGGTVRSTVQQQPPPDPPPTTQAQQTTTTKTRRSSTKSNTHNNHHNNHPNNHNSISSSGAGSRSTKRHTRPLMFTHNSNGSMVDLRCVNRECVYTTPFQGTPTTNTSTNITSNSAPPNFTAPNFTSLPPQQTTHPMVHPSSLRHPIAQHQTSIPPHRSRSSQSSSSTSSRTRDPYIGRDNGPYTTRNNGPYMPRDKMLPYATPYGGHPAEPCEDQRLLVYQGQSKV